MRRHDRRNPSPDATARRRRDRRAALVCLFLAALVVAALPASRSRAQSDENTEENSAENAGGATASGTEEPDADDARQLFPGLEDALAPSKKDAASDRQDENEADGDDQRGKVAGRLGGDGALMPDNHEVDWMRRHGEVARSGDNDCAECHTERECASCHDEKIAEPFSVHPPNFETLHAVDPRARRNDCADCHTLENFCTDCHTRANVTAQPGSVPPPDSDVHPPGWTDPGTANNHGVMARRNISECITCHTEDDCVSCHRGVDPHPPEFKLNCGRWLEANPRPCAECHGDLRRLERLCR